MAIILSKANFSQKNIIYFKYIHEYEPSAESFCSQTTLTHKPSNCISFDIYISFLARIFIQTVRVYDGRG